MASSKATIFRLIKVNAITVTSICVSYQISSTMNFFGVPGIVLYMYTYQRHFEIMILIATNAQNSHYSNNDVQCCATFTEDIIDDFSVAETLKQSNVTIKVRVNYNTIGNLSHL
jgi:hypothetical protein